MALLSVRPRRLVIAYALWLFTPLIWPGAYLFYLGRDTHAVLHTVSLGGFGIGWLLDAFYIPLYVADHNEPPGYLDRVTSGKRGVFSKLFGLLVSPLSLTLQLMLALYCGCVAAYLIPRPFVVPEALLPLLPADLRAALPLSRVASATLGFWVGMFAVALCVKLASVRLGRTRTGCKWRPVLLLTGVCSAALSPNVVDLSSQQDNPDELAHLPGLLIGAIGVMGAAASGRVVDIERSPRRCSSRRLSVRLLLQLIGVCGFAGATLGAFYLNGSYTHTDRETGKCALRALRRPTHDQRYHASSNSAPPHQAEPSIATLLSSLLTARAGITHTMSGPEALHAAYQQLGVLTSDIRAASAMLWERQKGKTWQEIWDELKEAFRDPAVEAAQVLGVSADASLEEVKRAHRNLARKHHPDKVGDDAEQQEAAKLFMQKLNWAKEVLAAKRV